jgi:hypothetical protein
MRTWTRHRWRSLLALVVLSLLVFAVAATRGPWHGTFSGYCRGMEASGYQVVDALPLRLPNGQPDRSRACLAYVSATNVYAVGLSGVYTLDEFRAAKAVAADRLRAKGTDPCSVVWWLTPVKGLPSGWDDWMTNGGECAPTVVAGDDGAAEWLPFVRETVAQTVELTAEQMGWRPNRPLRFMVVTDAEMAVEAYTRNQWAGPHAPLDEYTERNTRGGRSITFWLAPSGSTILVNLAGEFSRQQPPGAVRASIQKIVAHEYTHAAQHALLGDGEIPRWFEEGQAMYQEYRAFGHPYVDLRYAAQWQHDGKAFRLGDLTQWKDWDEREHTDGTRPIYNRSYAVVAFLVERYGFPATVQLLRDNHDHSIDQFDDALTTLTDLDRDGLDAAVDAWLLAPGRVLLADDFTSPSSPWMGWGGLPTQQTDYGAHEYVIAKPEDKTQEGNAQPVWLRDVRAEVDGRLADPSSGGGLWLDFCSPPDGGCYKLTVLPTAQSLSLWHGLYDGSSSTPIPQTTSRSIRPADQINRLGIEQNGAELVLLVNGDEIGRVHDDSLRGGVLWFGVYHPNSDPAEGRFSRLQVVNAE